MLRTTGFLIFMILSFVACDNSAEEKTTTPETSVELPEPNKTGFVSKGSMLFSSKEDAKVFLEAPLIHVHADTANKKADSLRLAYANDPNNIDVNFELGTHFAVLGSFTLEDEHKKRDSAIVMLTKVIETNPKYKNGAAYFNRGQTYAVGLKWEEAVQDINTYLDVDPEPEVYSQLILANANYAKGDSTKACEYIQIMQEGLGNSYNSATSIWEKRCK
ncbi:MAG: tetratricopeptide repeat protein [Aureispira sp.]|nr:tetratricopeptide repeat protein [Aureispira sp.]